jgi:quercetin dioxygenase-like cupin family protein
VFADANHEEGGEYPMSVDATRAPRVGETVLVMADLITFRVTAAQSGGRVTVVEVEAPPGGGPPPMHTHEPDEVFHVIEGEVTLFKGPPEAAMSTVLAVGDSEHVAGGIPHTFRNLSEHPAKLLLVFSPGDRMERFFAEVGHPVRDRDRLPQLDLEAEVPRVFEIGNRLGMELLSPPRET